MEQLADAVIVIGFAGLFYALCEACRRSYLRHKDEVEKRGRGL